VAHLREIEEGLTVGQAERRSRGRGGVRVKWSAAAEAVPLPSSHTQALTTVVVQPLCRRGLEAARLSMWFL